MDYKEKYDAALGIAKMWYKSTAVPKECKVIFESMFHEIKEGEDIENKRISKEITQFLKQNNTWNREWLTWLEKQGEQKHTDNKKIDVLKFIRKETCCGLTEANDALLKLIKVLKEHPLPIMDKPRKLKIEWDYT